MTKMRFPRANNLEWLRLVFAMQVVLVHTTAHIGTGTPAWLAAFPGVPAFFFVSGFLIYASYCNAPDRRYFENRFLRLFPALFLVAIGGLIVALLAKGLPDLAARPGLYFGWFFSQVTLGQAFNPAHFRDVGVGVINGSLWTITVEILFYVAVPVIVWMERNVTKHAVALLSGASFAIYVAGPAALTFRLAGKGLYEYLAITPIAWGWMFGFGMLAVKNWSRIAPNLKYFPIALVPMVAMALYGSGPLFNLSGERMGLLYFACYAGLILYAAFGIRAFPLRFDISYGTYVWHMPIINLLIVMGFPDPALAIPLVVAAAAVSWFCVEKPALALKRKSIKPVEDEVARPPQPEMEGVRG
ncbi:acyltransferase family protein [Pelagerythrobacter marensis]|uniref:Nodulation protein X n=1 Tax=Pelagerythrobacter marensis TaxID=543877 RepID=A0A0G3XAF3_9SPHN|nr:acyltransferase [Pelagerythrobacter marensis]AKM08177.1 Nodulation protein X [Pelagerythrobacter marensis]